MLAEAELNDVGLPVSPTCCILIWMESRYWSKCQIR